MDCLVWEIATGIDIPGCGSNFPGNPPCLSCIDGGGGSGGGGGGNQPGDGAPPNSGSNPLPPQWTDWEEPWVVDPDPIAPGFRDPPQRHHIATDKHESLWTPFFEMIFDDADMSLQDERNLVALVGHETAGAHSNLYHEEVFRRLRLTTLNKEGNEYRWALQEELFVMKNELLTPGTELRRLLFGHD